MGRWPLFFSHTSRLIIITDLTTKLHIQINRVENSRRNVSFQSLTVRSLTVYNCTGFLLTYIFVKLSNSFHSINFEIFFSFHFHLFFQKKKMQQNQIITLNASTRIKTCDLELSQLLLNQSSASSTNLSNASTPTTTNTASNQHRSNAIDSESGRAVDNQYSFV